MMCFNFDLNPEYRVQVPNFYGYIPSDGRARLVVMISMFFFSACHITMKLIGVGLLATISATYVGVFLGGDMLVYFCYKIGRHDLRYWLRVDGALSWIVSITLRVFVKVIVDFSTFVQARHPNEIGEKL